MAYLLLAIGALMSAAGAYSIITGSHIIQVEEGWASVIAGATLFAGGIVTMALGLVLRALTSLRTVFVGQPILAPVNDAIAPINPPAPTTDVVPAVPQIPKPEPKIGKWRRTKDPAPDRIAPTPPPPPPRPADKGERLEPVPVPASQPPDREPLLLDAGEPIVETPEPVDDYKLETPSTSEHDLPEHPPVVSVAETAPPVPKPPVSLPRVAPPPPLPAPVFPQSPPPPLVPAPAPTSSSPAMDDWLDRAFAEFDQDLPKRQDHSKSPDPSTSQGLSKSEDTSSLQDLLKEQDVSGAPDVSKAEDLPRAQNDARALDGPEPQDLAKAEDAPSERGLPKTDATRTSSGGQLFKTGPIAEPAEPQRPPAPEPELEPAHAQFEPPEAHAATVADPTPSPAAAMAPPLPAPTSAVIGRYEADGTSYVMYADGSIEAHSDIGVYRFASMAELKAFIES